jgi:DNA-binding GntR family transcriptional regulator
MLPEGEALYASSHEHAELLDVIEAGDADAAESLMRRHIGHVRSIWSEKALETVE